MRMGRLKMQDLENNGPNRKAGKWKIFCHAENAVAGHARIAYGAATPGET